MENNENEMKPQTGGLKLMTVFVFVLALHVVVIGGMTAYYVFRSSTAENETMADKSTGIKGENLPGEATAPEATEKAPGVFTISQETLAATQSNSVGSTPTPVEPTPATAAAEPASVPTPAAPAEQPVVAESVTPAVTPEAPVTTAPVTEPVKNEVATTPEAIPAPAIPTVPVTPIEFTPAPAPVVASTPAVTAPAPVSTPTVTTPAVASTPAVTTPAPVVTPTPPNLLPPPEAPRLVANATKSTLSIPEASTTVPAPATTPAPAPVTVKPTTPEVAKTATAATSKFVTVPVTKLETTTTKKVASEKTTSEKNVYTVKAHDSLEKIAHKNDTTVAKLRAANSLNSDFLSIGQKLNIPVKSHNTAIVSTTDKSAKAPEKSVAKTADKTVKVATTAAKATAAKAAAKTTTHVAAVTTTPSKAKTYTVAKGDTLIKIARDYKTTPKALMAANGITDPTKLSIGKQLKIPAATKTASTKIKTPQLANNEQ